MSKQQFKQQFLEQKQITNKLLTLLVKQNDNPFRDAIKIISADLIKEAVISELGNLPVRKDLMIHPEDVEQRKNELEKELGLNS